MATPRTVQRQLEQANALQAQAEAAPGVEVVTDASQLIQAPAQAPAPEAPPQAPAPAAAPPADAVDWQKRYVSLQGMFNAEVPRLQATTRTQESQINALSEQVRALTAAATKPTPEPPAKPAIDPRDADQFGEPMMDMVQRYVTGAITTIQSQVSAALTGLDGRVKALEGKVQGVSQRAEDTLEQQFWTLLAQLVPDYGAIDASDAWKAWLAEVDPLTGRQRQELLNAAQGAMNAKRVAVFFDAFKATVPPPASAALNNQVSPSAGGGAAAPTPNRAAQVITQAFIQKFYGDQIRGVYKGREAEAAQIEAAINQAAAEGRVR